jgi:hypothetical protein
VLAGDLNGDERVNVADAVYLLLYLFSQGRAPWCPALANTNGDVSVNVADAVYLLLYLFREGPPPVPPEEPCPE